jgi:RNA polymerase sigma-70 factor (ECF subfamily)
MAIRFPLTILERDRAVTGTRMVSDTEIEPARPEPHASLPAGERGKAKLFLRLFLHNQWRLYAYVLTLLPRRADADDVFQEASLVMWDKFDEANPPDDFAAWGCRIAYFKVLDFCKKRQRSRVQFSQAMLERIAETAAEQSSALQLDERREALAGCLGRLSPRDRDLLTRRFAEGATVQTTAAQVGRSADAVYKALVRIRRALFDCVSQTLAAGGQQS